MAETTRLQLVTFELAGETYGIDIMQVEGIVQVQDIRPIPYAPEYVEGIFNLRGEIIPVINLHRRFRLQTVELSEEDKLLSGMVVLSIDRMHLAVMIDKVSRVVRVRQEDIQSPPQMISGIGAEYIQGVVNNEDSYLIILDARRLFNVRELEQLGQIGR
ncbi:MAG: chemotaxis protein CheW [Spirochaetaceae bacterium]